MKELQFYDAYFDKEYMYFSALDFNGLFRVKKGEHNAEFIMHFPGDLSWQMMMHRQIINVGRTLFFIPFNAHGISVYHIDEDKMEYISIPCENKLLNFSNAIHIKNKYLLIPNYMKQPFVWLDPYTQSVVIEDRLETIRKELYQSNNLAAVDFYGSICIENNLYINVCETKKLLNINLDTFDVKVIDIPFENTHNIIYYKNDLWFSLNEPNKIFRYNLNTHEYLEYIFEEDSEIKRPIYAFLPFNDTIITIPRMGNHIYIYDNKLDKWNVLVDVFNGDFERVLKWFTLFMGHKINNEEVFLFPRSGNGMLIINPNDTKIENYQINIEDEFYDRVISICNHRKIHKSQTDKKFIRESDNIGENLVSFLSYVKELN